jgi:glutamyl-tRNA(Gln) amidotransferase subunit E
MMDYACNIDYRAIGLKAGLEIHQQLASRTKLFCCCPNEIRKAEDSDFEFFRYLRARESEMGEVDRAAAEQAMTRKKFIYKAYDTTCLIEDDEEPPMPLNPEALDIALKASVLFNMRPADGLPAHLLRRLQWLYRNALGESGHGHAVPGGRRRL